MRTRGLRVHLTSLTLILVIAVSGKKGVRGARLRVGDYTGADVNTPVSS